MYNLCPNFELISFSNNGVISVLCWLPWQRLLSIAYLGVHEVFYKIFMAEMY